MNYALMTINQLTAEQVKINCMIIELRGKMDGPCTNREWLGMDANLAILQEAKNEVQQELNIANLL